MKKIYLHLNSRDEFLRIDISKIVYFEADGNYTNIILANKLNIPMLKVQYLKIDII